MSTAETLLSQVKVELGKAENSNNRSIFDARTSTILHDCDEKCESLLNRLGILMLHVFQWTCFAGWSLKRGPVLIELARKLWSRYSKALERLVAPAVDHHTNLLHSGSGGAIQQAYQNRMVRDSLYKLVSEKMSTLHDLVIDFNSILKGGENDTTNSSMELCVLYAYRHHVEGHGTWQTIFPDQESEDLLKRLVTVQIHLSQRTLNSPSPEDLKKRARDQREEIVIICRKMRKNVIAMEDFALKAKHNFLRSNYKMVETFYYDIEKYRKKNCYSGGECMSSSAIDNGGIVRDLTSLLQLSTQLVLQWLPVLCSRQCNATSMTSLDLPPRLATWIDNFACLKNDLLLSDVEKSIDSKFPVSVPGNVNLEKNACKPGVDCGARRISSIFAGLLYRWFEARCSEWHAEVTRDELLQSMDKEIPVVLAEGGVKGSKKKKSNRKSGGGNKVKNKDEQTSVAIASNDDTATTSNITNITLSSSSSLSPSNDSIPIDHASEDGQLSITPDNDIINNGVINPNDDNGADDASSGAFISQGDANGGDRGLNEIEHCHDNIIISNWVSNPDNENNVADDATISTFISQCNVSGVDGGLNSAECEHCPGVWIVDGKEVISAEMYLVKRLQMVLELNGMEFTTTMKKFPVVWL